jgi:rare lipoprotein A
MKKMHIVYLLCSMLLISCGGHRTAKPDTTPPAASTPPASSTPSASADAAAAKPDSASKPGGYYLDDGPGENPPANLERIPDAVPKEEPLQPRLNKPYVALGQTYQPMTKAQSYKKRGVASWYGKRFHGRKTSSGELYDMYAMTAAHTVLPLPSYAKVTNVANGRSVVVRINDRGPFKKDRIIDLSYAAAYKLGLIARGSGLVEVEAVDKHYSTKRELVVGVTETTQEIKQAALTTNSDSMANGTPAEAATSSVATALPPASAEQGKVAPAPVAAVEPSSIQSYYVQAGAFKNEVNADNLMKRIQALEIAPNIGISRVYNNALHRLRLGPFSAKGEAELLVSQLRKQLNVPAIILNQ